MRIIHIHLIKSHLPLFVVHEEFRLLVFKARSLNGQVLHTWIFSHIAAHVLCQTIELVVIIARKRQAIAAIQQVQGIAKPSLAHAISAPVSAANRYHLAYHLIFQAIWERGLVNTLFEVNNDFAISLINASDKLLDFLIFLQRFLHNHHLGVKLHGCTAHRHLCSNVQYLFRILITPTAILIQIIGKHLHGASQPFRQQRFVCIHKLLVAKCLVIKHVIPRQMFIIRLFRSVSFAIRPQAIRQELEWNAECQHQQDIIHPFTMGGECDITAVEAIVSNDHPTQPEMLPLAAILPTVDDGWHKKQRHDQRHHQIDDDYPSEIVQVLLQFLRKEKNDHHRPYRGEHSRQQRQESLAVVIITIMIDHHNRRVNDKS